MATVIPTQLFTGYSSDGTDVTLPIAALPALTAAEADASTGNAAEFVRAILDQSVDGIAALAVENRPANFSITKSALQSANSPTVITQTYTVTVRLTPTALNVAPEA